MRKGFSFVEVLISIAILSFLGLALIKFNSFNKRAMEYNILKQEAVLLSSVMLYESKIDNDKEVELLSLIKFKNLNDEDKKFLRSIILSRNEQEVDKLFLANDGEENLYIIYNDLDIKYKDYTQRYLYISNPDEKK